jgi:hypothetical protein
MSPATVVIRVQAVSPARAEARWMRVLIVSMGALVKGPTAPEMRPMPAVCHDGSSLTSGCISCNFFRRAV